MNFAPGRIPFGGKSPQNVYIVYQPVRRPNILPRKKERKKKERKKTQTTAAKYNGMPNPIGRPQKQTDIRYTEEVSNMLLMHR